MDSLRLRSNADVLSWALPARFCAFAPTITHDRKSLYRGTHYTAMVVAGQSITGQPALFPSSPQWIATHR